MTDPVWFHLMLLGILLLIGGCVYATIVAAFLWIMDKLAGRQRREDD